MPDKSQNRDFHHALTVHKEICIGCTHCMTVCPTQAVRVRKGKAVIIANRCVDCGECYKACPVSAIDVEQDDLKTIFNFPVRVILVPSVLIGQFPEKINTQTIYKSLLEIGFTHVYEVENSVDMVLEAYDQYRSNQNIRPLISSFCPAIVRLIQVRFPSLVGNIMRVNPPIDMTAWYYKERLKLSGIHEEEIGIYYATPCAAKIAAIKSPVGEKKSSVTGVINMNFLYNRILQYLQKKENDKEMDSRADDLLSSRGVLWSLTRGEIVHSNGRALAIDGIKNVTEFLESIENEKLDDIDFLELRACDESCAGGILISGNRFLTVERLNKRAAEFRLRENDSIRKKNEGFLNISEHSFIGDIQPRPIAILDEDVSMALKKMERKRRMMCFLPGFDCAGCGAPDCETLSEDIVQGKAQISHCIFMQQQMIKQNLLSLGKAISITEEIWGGERLEKNCNKLGAEDENS